MEEILRSPVEVDSLSHYLKGVLYIPGGAGFIPSTVGHGRKVPLESGDLRLI